jgi:hypothetical protein
MMMVCSHRFLHPTRWGWEETRKKEKGEKKERKNIINDEL